MYITAKYKLIPPTHFGEVPGKSAQDALLIMMNDVETAWHHNKVVSMLTYDITRFFDTIPHLYLIQTMCTLHVSLPLVQWTYSFLQNRKATIRLDEKQDPLSPINTGVPCHAPSQLDLGEPSHMHIHLTTDCDSTQLNALPCMGNAEYSPTQTSPTSTDISGVSSEVCQAATRIQCSPGTKPGWSRIKMRRAQCIK